MQAPCRHPRGAATQLTWCQQTLRPRSVFVLPLFLSVHRFPGWSRASGLVPAGAHALWRPVQFLNVVPPTPHPAGYDSSGVAVEASHGWQRTLATSRPLILEAFPHVTGRSQPCFEQGVVGQSACHHPYKAPMQPIWCQ